MRILQTAFVILNFFEVFLMEEFLHAWRIVGDLCGSLMEVCGQGPPRRCGGLGSAC